MGGADDDKTLEALRVAILVLRAVSAGVRPAVFSDLSDEEMSEQLEDYAEEIERLHEYLDV